MAGKGRGIIVTEAVTAGALLAVGKPLGIAQVIILNPALVQKCSATVTMQTGKGVSYVAKPLVAGLTIC